MEALLLIIMAAACIVCFMLGAKVGQAVKNGEKVEIPSVNPLKAIAEHREKREAEKEQERIDTILENIENYDGTAVGQKDVPRRS